MTWQSSDDGPFLSRTAAGESAPLARVGCHLGNRETENLFQKREVQVNKEDLIFDMNRR
jgi:urease accessory protein UreE